MKRNAALFLVLFIAFFNMSKALAENAIYYVVQVGYYKNPVIMEEDFKTIANKGLPIYKVPYNGGYRFYLGNYASREEAEKAANIVNEMGFETLIRTMEKKPKVVNPSPPEKKVEEKSLKTTDNITDNLTDKSPVDTDQGLENQAEKSEKKGLSAHKANLPQKKDNLSYTPHEFSMPDKELNGKSYTSNESNKPQGKSIYYMFCTTFIIIVAIGTIATYKRNEKY